MNKTVFTYWEGTMPDYIKLCIKTWKVPFVILDNKKLNEYTNIYIDSLKKFTLPQIADYIRVHVLRDNGGYWLDADTIMVTDQLPNTNMIGNPISRTNTIGFLYTEAHSEMFTKWAEYQDMVVSNPNSDPKRWSIMGNDFTDNYLLNNNEITISSVRSCWPETYMINGDDSRYKKYLKFYFNKNHHLSDLHTTNMLMLHNSWTPDWYKKMSERDVLSTRCTMSNILKETI